MNMEGADLILLLCKKKKKKERKTHVMVSAIVLYSISWHILILKWDCDKKICGDDPPRWRSYCTELESQHLHVSVFEGTQR